MNMKVNFHNAIWRSRAVAILGIIALLILIFPGLPSPLRTTFLIALTLATTCLGLAGSRHRAYRAVEPNSEEAVIKNQPAGFSEEAEPVYSEETIIVSTPEPAGDIDDQS